MKSGRRYCRTRLGGSQRVLSVLITTGDHMIPIGSRLEMAQDSRAQSDPIGLVPNEVLSGGNPNNSPLANPDESW